MVRIIYVVYTNQKLSNSQLRGMKQYMFLCPYDIIQAGDMIEDNRYSTPMQVVSWSRNTAQVQNGITLKVIEPSRLNGLKVMCTLPINGSDFDIDKQRNNMEARNISVTLEQAREWYNGCWEMGAGRTGYFIGKSSMGGSAVVAQVDLTHGIAIYEHKTVQYAGIVYFKSAEDAKKAAKMLGADIRYLF
jgi:hypothetical protein